MTSTVDVPVKSGLRLSAILPHLCRPMSQVHLQRPAALWGSVDGEARLSVDLAMPDWIPDQLVCTALLPTRHQQAITFAVLMLVLVVSPTSYSPYSGACDVGNDRHARLFHLCSTHFRF